MFCPHCFSLSFRSDSSDDDEQTSGTPRSGKRATAAGARVVELARECGISVSERDLQALRSLVPDRGSLRKTRERERTQSASKTEKTSTSEERPSAPQQKTSVDSDDALSDMGASDVASLPEFARFLFRIVRVYGFR